MSADPISTFLEALNDADPKQSGDYWQLHCPAHEDKQHSLSLARGNDGRALLKCFAGCDVAEIVKRVGLSMGDLFPTAEERKPLKRSWAIKSDKGETVAIHHRTDRANGKKEISWERDGSNGLNGLNVRKLPLYGMEQTPDVEDSEPVIICEGEKAADALMAVGIKAMGTVTGASSIPDLSVLARIKHLNLCLWPDNDETGRAHMVKIAEAFAGLKSTVRMIEWPDAPEKGDAFEYVSEGRGKSDVLTLVESSKPWVPSEQPKSDAQLLPKAEVSILPTGEYKIDFSQERISYVVKSLTRNTRNFDGFVTVLWWPSHLRNTQTLVYNHHVDFRSGSSKSQLSTQLKRFQQQYEPPEGWHVYHESAHQALDRHFRTGGTPLWDYELPEVEDEPYLVEPFLFSEQVSLFMATPSSSKSLSALALALSVVTGEPVMPGTRVHRQTNVLYLDYEDGPQTFRSRMRQLCAGMGVFVPSGRIRYRRMYGMLADAADEIREDILEHGVGLVVVDSGGKAVIGQIREEPTVMRLFDACRSWNTTVLVITHLPKDAENQKTPIGSQYWESEPRSIWKLVRDQQEAQSHIAVAFSDMKENHTSKRSMMTFRYDFSPESIAIAPADPSQYETTETAMEPTYRMILELLNRPFQTAKDLAELFEMAQSTVINRLTRNRDIFEPTNERPQRWSIVTHDSAGNVNPSLVKRNIYLENSSGSVELIHGENGVNSHVNQGYSQKGPSHRDGYPLVNDETPATAGKDVKRYRDPVTGENVEYL